MRSSKCRRSQGARWRGSLALRAFPAVPGGTVMIKAIASLARRGRSVPAHLISFAPLAPVPVPSLPPSLPDHGRAHGRVPHAVHRLGRGRSAGRRQAVARVPEVMEVDPLAPPLPAKLSTCCGNSSDEGACCRDRRFSSSTRDAGKDTARMPASRFAYQPPERLRTEGTGGQWLPALAPVLRFGP